MLFPKSWGLDQTSPVQLPFVANLIIYLLFWVIVLVGLYFIFRRSRTVGFARWTTQDILIVAIMAVLLEVYDNLIGDQFITPSFNLSPLGMHSLLMIFPICFFS